MTGFVTWSAVQTQKESRVHSEVLSVIYVYRRLKLFIVHTTKPSYFASLTNWDYFHLGLFSYLNESYFELNTFSSTSTQQLKK